MTYLIPLFAMFLLGIILSSLFFITRRDEPANKSPITQLKEKYDELEKKLEANSARTSALEARPHPSTVNQETRERMALIESRNQLIEENLHETRNYVSTTVLRLLASYRPIERKRKEVSQ